MEQKLNPSDVESIINKQIAKVFSFKNSIRNMMMIMKNYELKEKKYLKKDNKYKLINHLVISIL